MVRKVLLGLLLVALLAGAVWGLMWGSKEAPPTPTSWVKVSANATATIYLDSAMSKRVGSHIMVWLLRDYNATQYAGGVGFLSSKDQIEVDCTGLRIRRIYSSNHPQAMGAGEFVSSEHGPMSWNSVAQDDIMWRALNIACLNSTGP